MTDLDKLLQRCQKSKTFFEVATGAKGSLILLATKPTQRATILKHNATIHTAKFEEGKDGTIWDRAANLQTSTSITLYDEIVEDLLAWEE